VDIAFRCVGKRSGASYRVGDMVDTGPICAAPGCTLQARPQQFMCRDHWARLPNTIQIEVYRTWRNVHRDMPAYREAREKAIQWHRDHPSMANSQRSFL
jgi:hypothetical protein